MTTSEAAFPMTATEYAERAAQLANLIASRDARVEAHHAHLKEYKEEIDGTNESVSALADDIRARGIARTSLEPGLAALVAHLVAAVVEQTSLDEERWRDDSTRGTKTTRTKHTPAERLRRRELDIRISTLAHEYLDLRSGHAPQNVTEDRT